ncbi:MAG: hypothetical protein ABSC94_32270 [Polyangiaceae bacterium]
MSLSRGSLAVLAVGLFAWGCRAGGEATSPLEGGIPSSAERADSCPGDPCIGSCLAIGAIEVSTVVDGCEVWQCCVVADAGAEAAPGDATASPGDADADAPGALADVTSGGPDGGDARSDAAPSIAEACADGGEFAQECSAGWSQAQNASYWCPRMNTLDFSRVTRGTDCQGYDTIVLSGMDSAGFYFFSLQTGDLVGIGGAGNSGEQCLVGQCPSMFSIDCSDGGTTAVFFCGGDGGITD